MVAQCTMLGSCLLAALLLLIVSPLVILRTPTDIFPNINIPVVSIVWQYTGMAPTEFAGRITSVFAPGVHRRAADLQPGGQHRHKAYLQLTEFPGEKFEGNVTNISGALDPSTRTLRTEVQVPNADGRLFPGAYAQVDLVLPVKPALVIPSNTLLFRGDGLQVGIVDANDIVHLRTVKIGRDFGSTVEVITGLEPADRLIVNPSDSLGEGTRVHADSGKSEG